VVTASIDEHRAANRAALGGGRVSVAGIGKAVGSDRAAAAAAGDVTTASQVLVRIEGPGDLRMREVQQALLVIPAPRLVFNVGREAVEGDAVKVVVLATGGGARVPGERSQGGSKHVWRSSERD
jgi:cell division GTPase FtsZ